MLPIRRAFSLTDEQQEVVVSSTILAAFASIFILGEPLNTKYGRRVAILFAAATFAIGSCCLGFAWNYTTLVMGRIIVGIGIGVASLTTPIYIAEVALPHMRGKLVTINAFMWYVSHARHLCHVRKVFIHLSVVLCIADIIKYFWPICCWDGRWRLY
jgi:MFS transporter, SP family, solute carrier family 2 (myo-inositol transporter), member 13